MKYLKMKSVMETEDGGKTWRITRIDYLVDNDNGEFVDSDIFNGVEFKVNQDTLSQAGVSQLMAAALEGC